MLNEWMQNQHRVAAAALALVFFAGCTTTAPQTATDTPDQGAGPDNAKPALEARPRETEPGPKLLDYRVLHPEAEPEPARPEPAPSRSVAKEQPAAPAKKTRPAPAKKTAKATEAKAVDPTPSPKRPAAPKPPADEVGPEAVGVAAATPDDALDDSFDDSLDRALGDAIDAAAARSLDGSLDGSVDDSLTGNRTSTLAESPPPVVSLDSLPLTFGQWELDLRSWSSSDIECILTSPSIEFFDGYEQSGLTIEISDQGLQVETESAVDLSYQASGLRLQEAAVIPFTGLLNTTGVEIERDIWHELDGATEFTLLMGFWPTWPQQGVREISVSLEGLRPALAAFERCQAL